MHIRSILSVVSVTSTALLSISCAGSMEDNGGTETVGKHAELVSKKREWLKGYHDDCQICFSAFEQCERGSVSAQERESCQIALDACVRGGLSDDEDAGDGGVDPADDDDLRDASVRDAGVPGARDGGVTGTRDAGASTGGQGNPGDSDAGVKNPGSKNPDKRALLEDIGNCLDEMRTCAKAANADKRACIASLKSCVKTAVSGTFEGVCARELNACVKERVPEDALQSVRSLCEEELVP